MNERQVAEIWARALSESRQAAEKRTAELVQRSADLTNNAARWCRDTFPELCECDEPHHYLVLGAIALRKRLKEGARLEPAAVLAWAHAHHKQMAKRGQGDPGWPALIQGGTP